MVSAVLYYVSTDFDRRHVNIIVSHRSPFFLVFAIDAMHATNAWAQAKTAVFIT